MAIRKTKSYGRLIMSIRIFSANYTDKGMHTLDNEYKQKKSVCVMIRFKLNSVRHLFHWIDVQDILFQLRCQYISRIEKITLDENYKEI
jgi:hypothetical protein